MVDIAAPVATGIKVPESSMFDVIGTMGKLATTQNAINTNQQFQQTFAARQRAGQIMATSPDLETGLGLLYKDPLVAPFAGEIVNSVRQGMLAQTQREGELQKQGLEGFSGFLKAAPGAIANPQAFDKLASGYLGQVNPQVRSRVAAGIKDLRASLTDNLPEDPLQSQAELNRRFAALATAANLSPETFAIAAGKPSSQDVGGSTVFGRTDSTTGAFTPAGAGPTNALGKTLAPQVVEVPRADGSVEKRVIGGGAPNALALPGAPNLTGPSAAPAGSTAPAPGTPTGVLGRSPSQQASEYNKDRGKALADYEKDLDSTVKVGAGIQKTVEESRDALAKFKPGGGASAYAGVAQFAQALGASQDLVDKIANGDLAASQEFNKLMVNTTMGQIKEQLQGVGASRLSQMEFQSFMKNNPNINTDPRAIEKIFKFWTKIHQQNYDEQTELRKFKKSGGDMTDWPNEWQRIARDRGYIKPSVDSSGKSTGNDTETPAPAKAKSPAERPSLDSFYQ